MPEYTTKYLFDLQVQGEQAVQAARKFRQQMDVALQGSSAAADRLAASERALEAQYERTNAVVTSQTRRLSYYMRRLDEVGGHVQQLESKLQSLYSTMSAGGLNAFDGLIQGAKAASDTIVGQSIIPDMVKKVKAEYADMDRAGQQAFDNLSRAADKLRSQSRIAPTARLEDISVSPEDVPIASWPVTKALFEHMLEVPEIPAATMTRLAEASELDVNEVAMYIYDQIRGQWSYESQVSFPSTVAGRAFGITGGYLDDPPEVGALLGDTSKVEALFRAVATETQSLFRSLGIEATDLVNVYRGLSFVETDEAFELGRLVGPEDLGVRMESWTLNPSVAVGFAQYHEDEGYPGVVLRALVEAKDLLSAATAGFGDPGEHEVLVNQDALRRIAPQVVGAFAEALETIEFEGIEPEAPATQKLLAHFNQQLASGQYQMQLYPGASLSPGQVAEQAAPAALQLPPGSVPVTILADLAAGLTKQFEKVFGRTGIETTPFALSAAQNVTEQLKQLSDVTKTIGAVGAKAIQQFQIEGKWPYESGSKISVRETAIGPLVGLTPTRVDPEQDFESMMAKALDQIAETIRSNEEVLGKTSGYLSAINVLPDTFIPESFLATAPGAAVDWWQGMYDDSTREIYLQLRPGSDVVDTFWHEIGHTFAAQAARLDLPELVKAQQQIAAPQRMALRQRFTQGGTALGMRWLSEGGAATIASDIEEALAEDIQKYRQASEVLQSLTAGISRVGLSAAAMRELAQQPPQPDRILGAVAAGTVAGVAGKVFPYATTPQLNAMNARLFELAAENQQWRQGAAAARMSYAPTAIGGMPIGPVYSRVPTPPAARLALPPPSRAMVPSGVVGGAGGGGAQGPPVEDISYLYGTGGGGISQIAGEVTAQGPNILDFFKQFSIGLNMATMQYFGLRRLGYGLQSVGRGMERWGQGVIGQLQGAAEAYLVFNKSATLAATAMELPIAMQDELETALREISMQLGTFTGAELAEGIRLWAAGTGTVVKTTEDLNRVIATTTTVQKLAAMNGVELGETMTIVGSILAEYGLQVEDVGAVTGVLNFVAAKTFANVNDVGAAFKMVGPVAAGMGISFTETATALGLLSDANIKGSMAGRAIRQLFLSLLDPTADMNKTMNSLLGTNADLAESWKTLVFPKGEFIGLAKFVDLLAAATENQTQLQRNEALAVLATANALPALITLVNEQIKAREDGINVLSAFEKSMLGVTDAETEAAAALAGLDVVPTGAADLFEQQWERVATSASNEADRVRRRWESAMMGIGQATTSIALGPIETLVRVLEGVAGFVEQHPSIAGAAGVAAIAALVSGKLLVTIGTLANAAASMLILRGAFAQFGGAVGTFSAAVSTFSVQRGVPGGVGAVGAGVVGTAVLPALTLGAITLLVIAGVRAGVSTLGGAIEGALDLEPPSLERQQANYAYAAATGYRGTFEEFQVFTGIAADDTFTIAENADATAAAYERAQLAMKEGGLAAPIQTGAMMPAGYEDVLAEYQNFLDQRNELMESYMDNVHDLQDARQEQMVAEVEAYYDKRQDLEEAHYERLADITEDGLDRRNDIMERAVDRAEDAARSYQQRVADAGEDYTYRQVQKEEEAAIRRQAIIERYNEWVVDQRQGLVQAEQDHIDRLGDMWEDFQRAQERAREDHVDRLWDLVATRDARGLLREARDYTKARKRREQDYQKSVGRENERWAKEQERSAHEAIQRREELAKQLAAFDAAEQRRKEKDAEAQRRQLELLERAFERQLANIREDREEDLIKLEESIAERKEKEAEAYKERQDDLEEAHTERMQSIDEQYREGLEKQADHHRKSLRELEYQSREIINAHVDAIEGITRATERPWRDQLTALETWLGRQLEALRTFEGELAAETEIIVDLWTELGAVYRAWQGAQDTEPPPEEGDPVLPPREGGPGGPYIPQGANYGVSSALLASSYRPGMAGPAGRDGRSVLVQQTGWVFEGSMSESDKAWYKIAAKDAAFTAMAEVL